MPNIRSLSSNNGITFNINGVEHKFEVKDIPLGVFSDADPKAKLEEHIKNVWLPTAIPKVPTYQTEFVSLTPEDIEEAKLTSELEGKKEPIFEIRGDKVGYSRIKLDEDNEPIVIGEHDECQIVVHVDSVSPLSVSVMVANLDVVIPPNWWVNE